MKIFTLKKVAAGAALFSLFACGDDNSSGSKGQDIFSTKDDLPECTEKIAGDTLYVESDSADYFCEDGKWILVGDTTGTDTSATDTSDVSSSSGKNPSSSSAADTILSSSSTKDSSSSATVSSSSSTKESSSSATVSSSSDTREYIKQCPNDTISKSSFYIDGDSVVVENFEQASYYSAFIDNAYQTDIEKMIEQAALMESTLNDTTKVCEESDEDATSILCDIVKNGGHISLNIDSTKAYGPWGVTRIKMPNSPANISAITQYLNIDGEDQLCNVYKVNLYGCLDQTIAPQPVARLWSNGPGSPDEKLNLELQFAYQNYIESEKTIVDAIDDASNAGDWAKVAELTGLKSSDPYMELFKNAKVETRYGHGVIEFLFHDVDVSKQSLVKSIIQSDCKDIRHHWIISTYSSFGSLIVIPASSSSSVMSSSSSEKSSSSSVMSSSSSVMPSSSSAVFSSSSEEPSSSSAVFSSSSEEPSSSSAEPSSSSVMSSSSSVMSSASEAVFNDEHLDFLVEFGNFSKSDLSTADTTIWKASKRYLQSQSDASKTFVNSLVSALEKAHYMLVSNKDTTAIYQLDTADYTYRVEINIALSSKGTNVVINAQKIKV
ncbi:hypothetical protein [uncultured Fibrobacter sp.]|uniref:hypothetical protein n=1 Tax=uncultured Fibrobacter sp. TaxID=261512 RepID=UPI0025E99F37|nr:hypothetical protein [uncultured Fibrobacter sp.]